MTIRDMVTKNRFMIWNESLGLGKEKLMGWRRYPTGPVVPSFGAYPTPCMWKLSINLMEFGYRINNRRCPCQGQALNKDNHPQGGRNKIYCDVPKKSLVLKIALWF